MLIERDLMGFFLAHCLLPNGHRKESPRHLVGVGVGVKKE